jgi:hypothetical protein
MNWWCRAKLAAAPITGYWVGRDGSTYPVTGDQIHPEVARDILGLDPYSASMSSTYGMMFSMGYARLSLTGSRGVEAKRKLTPDQAKVIFNLLRGQQVNYLDLAHFSGSTVNEEELRFGLNGGDPLREDVQVSSRDKQ